MKINRNFDNLVPNYLFADVARKTNEFAAAHPGLEIIRLGIGDVTQPLCPAVIEPPEQFRDPSPVYCTVVAKHMCYNYGHADAFVCEDSLAEVLNVFPHAFFLF